MRPSLRCLAAAFTVFALILCPHGVAFAADSDADGVDDALDNCPAAWNLGQDDRDGDAIGDLCDNCRFAANPGQEQSAGYGVGTACQCGDLNGDGATNVVDSAVLGRVLGALPAGSVALEKCPAAEPGGACDGGARAALRESLALALAPTQVCVAALCPVSACNPATHPCPGNRIADENRLAGSPPSEWDVRGDVDDSQLVGFTTNESYAPGELVEFKIEAGSFPPAYQVKIFRLGWYGGLGARHVVTLQQNFPVQHPACQQATDPVDCSNWSVTDVWQIPPTQISGVYLARIIADPPTSLGSHIVFVIRDDEGGSDILFQTSDTTRAAYNGFGGSPDTSLYNGAVRVSYDRPQRTPNSEAVDQNTVWAAQYHLLRFLERNGYDVSYFAGVDTARRGAELAEHRVFLSSGHDEYWSREMRDAVEAARNAGTHVMFLSGNLMFWKVRFENDFRTVAGYKTTAYYTPSLQQGNPNFIAPDDPVGFTGTWRDVRFHDPSDLAEPENSTTGLIFGVNGGDTALKVPSADSQLRLWRGTKAASAASCSVTHLAPHTLGYEWDHDEDNGSRPPGLFRASSTNHDHANVLYGSGSFAAGSLFAETGVSNHHVVAQRRSNGSWLFNAGSIQWALGLDSTHLPGIYAGNVDLTLAQASANALADMGVNAATPIDFCAPAPSADLTPPSSQIGSPAALANVRLGTAVEIFGTASDAGGGRVAGVEVSLDGGGSWLRAEGRESWRYLWRPSEVGSHLVRSRAVDDSGNLESPSATVASSVGCPSPCSIWPGVVSPTAPLQPDVGVELGLRFRVDVSGSVRAVRYWADAANPGPHTARLWSSTGALLDSATSTAQAVSGWREAVFAAPVPIAADTTYVASYHTSTGWASTPQGLANAWYRQPLAALRFGGVFAYGPGGSFPATASPTNRNYWVDVDFAPLGAERRRLFPGDPAPAVPSVFDAAAAADPWGVELGVRFRSAVDGVVTAVRFFRSDDSTAQIVNLWRDLGASHPLEPFAPPASGERGLILESGKTFPGTGMGWHRVPLARPVRVFAGETYVASYHTRNRWAYTDGYFTSPVSAPPLVAERSVYRYGKTSFPDETVTNRNYWVDVEFQPTAPLEHTLFSEATVPGTPHAVDPTPVEVGVRVTPEVDGVVEGIRFYKHPANVGVHTGSLWSGSGSELASATFGPESSCGWQEIRFATPVPVTKGSAYVASYHTTSGYAVERGYFGAWSPPLRALDDGEGGSGNGVYRYGAHGFPNLSTQASNYWVDLVFRSTARRIDEGPTPVPSYPLP